MSAYVNNNGVLIPAESYSIKAGNRAYIYGDGLFESIRVINGRPINIKNHVFRMKEGMKILRMICPASFTVDFIEHEIQTLIDQNGIDKGGRVRFSVDRKAGGFFMPHNNDIEYFIEANSLPNNKFLLNEAGLKIDQFEEMKKQINLLSSFKTKNGLIYIMAKLRARELGLDDLLIQNDRMGIIEGGSANLFIVSNGVLYTPGLDSGCLGGTMRMQIINIALANNIKVYECNISPQNLLVADEVFYTNAIEGIIWVGSYRTKQYINYLSGQLIDRLNELWKAKD
ncbi:MAG: aminotransferase class IV [Crocinitomicaceae bacterium]|jgi:branched-subunit amino acid aminotransferase/4-amino-4-deoxychorismate lyase|nr:aminotransferase class IV [Crocinitomicaceae bacterium]MBK9593110.1 aminotransferase class IV [Crocinitomicaceae bacterium]